MSAFDTMPVADLVSYSHTIGLSSMEGRGFTYPSDTAVGPDEKLYVLNRGSDGAPPGVRITVCNLEGEYIGVFGSHGEGDGQLIWPASIAIDKQGNIYVADEYTNRISVFDCSGRFLAKWGVQGTNDGELDGPSGLAFDRDDNLYAVDHRNGRIQKFSADGAFLSKFGSPGDRDGEFNLPWGLTVGPNGNVYVADWRNDRVQEFTADGVFLRAYGSSGRGDGQFHGPASVCVDVDGYMYIADWGNERVQVLDSKGRFVMKLRGEATDSIWAQEFLKANVEEAEARAKTNPEPRIQFFNDDPHEESSHIEHYFWSPVSVKLDGAGRLYVTESNRHRIQIYQQRSLSP